MPNYIQTPPLARDPAADPSPSLRRDAHALYNAMTAFMRFVQFRDRDHSGYHGLTITQCYLLECLHRRGALTLNQLADEMLLDKSTLSRIVDALEAKGAVTRRPHPSDGRSSHLGLTAAGRRSYLKVEADLVSENATLLRELPGRERRQLIAFLQRLTETAMKRRVSPIHDRGSAPP
jgi:DNA-binding MarR family transcriptional regulator